MNSIGFAFALSISKILFHFVDCGNVFVRWYISRWSMALTRKRQNESILEVKELTAHWIEPESKLETKYSTLCAMCCWYVIQKVHITDESTSYSKSNKFEAIQTIYIKFVADSQSDRFKLQKNFNVRFKYYYYYYY